MISEQTDYLKLYFICRCSATVVRHYKEYWVRITGPVVSFGGGGGGGGGTTDGPSTAVPAQTTSPAALSTAVSV